jgi:hypothetical protein
MKRISQLLREGRPFTIQSVADEFEVNRRTIQRDMDFMRDRLGYSMQWTSNSPENGGIWIGSLPKERIL